MTIDVRVQVERSGNAYLAGEVMRCKITFTNSSVPSSFRALARGELDERSTPSDDVESLAWASCQFSCQQIINERYVRLHGRHAKDGLHGDSAGTALNTSDLKDAGKSVLSSKPTILFCDLQLAPGEFKTYEYAETIPSDEKDVPPTFRGQAVKYLYKLTVATQRVGSTIKLLRVPFRVLMLPGLGCISNEEAEFRPSNPFLPKQTRHNLLELSDGVIETLSSGRSQSNFNVTHEQGSVASFTLMKKSYKLGEDVIGFFDFLHAEVVCLQCCVSLQTEEIVSDELKTKNSHFPIVVTHSRENIICLDRRDAQMSLSIPVEATPGFSSDLVTLKWKLYFEFTISTDQKSLAGIKLKLKDDSEVWQAPTNIPVQTLVWQLPVKIFPCNPLNAALGLAPEPNTVELTI